MICSFCALFGGHAGHIIKSTEEVLREQDTLIQQHQQLLHNNIQEFSK